MLEPSNNRAYPVVALSEPERPGQASSVDTS
jgi:hypothetical protein